MQYIFFHVKKKVTDDKFESLWTWSRHDPVKFCKQIRGYGNKPENVNNSNNNHKNNNNNNNKNNSNKFS